MSAEQALFVSLTCSSTRHPGVGRFVREGENAWWLVGVSRQRPGSSSVGLGAGLGSVNGSFGTTSEYAGCPSCHADGFVRCGNCEQLSCYDHSWEVFTCPSCGNSGKVSGYIETVSSVGEA